MRNMVSWFLTICTRAASQVVGAISRIRGNTVEFEDGKERDFDSLVFATGYRSTANTWLKVRTRTNLST